MGKCSDFMTIDKRLLPNKVFYFVFYGGLGVVLPYMSVFFKQLGLSPVQIGLISGVKPLVGWVSGTIVGTLADKFSKRKLFLTISVIGYSVIYFVVYFTKDPERIKTCPVTGDPLTVTSHTPETNRTNASEAAALPVDNIGWLYPPGELRRIFWFMLCLILCGEMFLSPATSLSDAATLQTLGRERLEEYGFHRSFGSLGWATCTFLAGAVLSSTRLEDILCGVKLFFTDYRIVSYVFIVELVFALIATSQLAFKADNDTERLELTSKNQPDHNVPPHPSSNAHDTWAVFRMFLSLHYGSWLATIFYYGVCQGVIWGFLYWHLENLGADQLMMSVSSMMTCISEFLCMIFLASRLIKLVGHMGVMYLSLLALSVRLCVYASVKNPWYVLFAEPLHGMTFGCAWVSVCAYSALAVPAASLATVQGILHGMYFGLGVGVGSLLGGVLTENIGAVKTFGGFSVASLLILAVLFVIQKFSTKPQLSSKYDNLDDDSDIKHLPENDGISDFKEQ